MRLCAALLTSVVLLLSACGGPDATDKQVSDLGRRLESKDSGVGAPLPKRQADCLARVYLEADLTERQRREVVKGQAPTARDEEESGKLSDVTSKIRDECL